MFGLGECVFVSKGCFKAIDFVFDGDMYGKKEVTYLRDLHINATSPRLHHALSLNRVAEARF